MDNLIVAVCLECQYQRSLPLVRKKCIPRADFLFRTLVGGMHTNELAIQAAEEARQIFSFLERLRVPKERMN